MWVLWKYTEELSFLHANSLCGCRQAVCTWVLAPQRWRGEGPPNVAGTPPGELSCSFIYGEMAIAFRLFCLKGLLEENGTKIDAK